MYENEMAKELEEMLPYFLKELEEIPDKEFIDYLVSQGAEFEPLNETDSFNESFNRLFNKEIKISPEMKYKDEVKCLSETEYNNNEWEPFMQYIEGAA